MSVHEHGHAEPAHDHGGGAHDHGHPAHDTGHDAHGHDAHSHDAHGHDDHGHGDAHGHEHWGDYNAKPLPPSNLPPVNPLSLALVGVALAVLLGMIVGASIKLSEADLGGHHASGHADKAGGHEKKNADGHEKKPH